jgi:uncharacterized protein YfkK (UPF0435 family)
VVLSEAAARQVSEIRALLKRGVLSRLRVPLPNGGTLSAEMFAEVVLNDLDYLTRQVQEGGQVSDTEWQRLVRDLGRLHDLAIPSA